MSIFPSLPFKCGFGYLLRGFIPANRNATDNIFIAERKLKGLPSILCGFSFAVSYKSLYIRRPISSKFGQNT